MKFEPKLRPLRQKFVAENPEVEKWLKDKGRKSEATRKAYDHIIYHYFQWLKEKKGITSAKQLLDQYRELKKENREYEHIDLAKEFLLNGKLALQSRIYRNQNWRTIRSFYQFNRCPLPKEKIDLGITETDEKRLREKQRLEVMTLEDVKKLVFRAKVRDRAILLVLLQSGMRVGELCDQFNTDEAQSVLKQLKENKCPIKINLIASREIHPQYFTFIGRDAIDALKEYLNVRGEVKDGEPIFITQRNEPIQGKVIDNQVQVLKRQTGLVNKDFTPHTLRDIFRTEASHQGMKPEIAEFFIGHALDQLGYNRLDEMYPQDFETEYSKVEPALNIVSYKPTVTKEEVRMEILRREIDNEAREQGLTRRDFLIRELAS